ncbi:SDR family oxidoreductase [Algoriphagus aestuariicola]|uniref:SDR family oxidoreductase n=1 Tax=Algoriphagus aestuariicola TaxID=1852016 RepID=A0ABS3BPA8_9BACT|nr:SDR family oxidoreductase [Algoriphagus aestuariicola]MBN7800746.1 SDR family oxidoreductase [Algoriphagus aestuariicola]
MANILIIGASSGIGLSLSKNLIADGHRVFGTFRKTEITHQGFEKIQQLDVLGDSLDLGFVPEILDGIAYCPGAIQLKPFLRIKPSDFIDDYQLQFLGSVKVLQACLPNLKNSPSSSIVLFSTVAVQLGFNFHSLVASSKGAIEGLTRTLAAEFAPKIRVNCIAPSITDTPLAGTLLNSEEKKEANAQRHPLKKIGTSEDIANLAAFLLTDKSAWITGQVLHADGGISSLKV